MLQPMAECALTTIMPHTLRPTPPWPRRLARRSTGTALALAALLGLASACSGNSDDNDGNVSTRTVKVAGDSLADGGTTGAKATVQGANLIQTRLWVDVVTQALGLAPLCPYYVDVGFGPVPNTTPLGALCTNHAVGGGVINVPGGNTVDDTPFSVPRQLEDLRKREPYAADELLLVDGGGNDLGLLLGLYLDTVETPVDRAPMLAVLRDLLDDAQMQAATSGGDAGLVTAGSQYTAVLADRMADALRDQALAFGARRVVVLNMPDVARTPRFTGLLARLSSIAGEQRAQAAAATSDAWAGAYNARLAQRLQAQPEVAIVDFRALLDGWIDDPQAAGFTNVTTPACPSVGTDDQGLPSYDLRTCTETLLTANPPAGASADGWRTWLFSDHFHGTPRMNERLADEVLRVMATKGWR